MNYEWGWMRAGFTLGVFLVLAIFLVEPVGVSSQFVVFDGILFDAVDTNSAHANAYLQKDGTIKAIDNPYNYGLFFVLAMILGGVISSLTQKDKLDAKTRTSPGVWHEKFGEVAYKRYVAVFFAGVLALYGARLANGCTSGHVLSGMMQTSLSGYMFAAGVFIAGIPTAILLYRQSRGK